MVDRSAVCVSYQTKPKGGTASTVKYAQAKRLTVRNLADSYTGDDAAKTE